MSRIKENNTGLYFPEKVYVGFQSSTGTVPLGFMSPYADDDAGKKRQETVNRWSSKSYDPVILDNKPLIGFKLLNEVDRSGYGYNGTVKWRVVDPRGFQLEISSGNFGQLLSEITIEQGEIQNEMVWARNGQVNVLISKESELYQTMLRNTSRKEADALDFSTIEIGNKVRFRNGLEAIFMGSFYTAEQTAHKEEKYGRTPRNFFKFNGNRYEVVNAPDLVEITNASTVSIKDSFLELKQYITTAKGYNRVRSGSSTVFDIHTSKFPYKFVIEKTKVNPSDMFAQKYEGHVFFTDGSHWYKSNGRNDIRSTWGSAPRRSCSQLDKGYATSKIQHRYDKATHRWVDFSTLNITEGYIYTGYRVDEKGERTLVTRF